VSLQKLDVLEEVSAAGKLMCENCVKAVLLVRTCEVRSVVVSAHPVGGGLH